MKRLFVAAFAACLPGSVFAQAYQPIRPGTGLPPVSVQPGLPAKSPTYTVPTPGGSIPYQQTAPTYVPQSGPGVGGYPSNNMSAGPLMPANSTAPSAAPAGPQFRPLPGSITTLPTTTVASPVIGANGQGPTTIEGTLVNPIPAPAPIPTPAPSPAPAPTPFAPMANPAAPAPVYMAPPTAAPTPNAAPAPAPSYAVPNGGTTYVGPSATMAPSATTNYVGQPSVAMPNQPGCDTCNTSMTGMLTCKSPINTCLGCAERTDYFWGRAEYLAWCATGGRLPPLVTSGPASQTVDQAGVIGAPGTTVLFGNGKYLDRIRHGFRFGAGMWLNQERTIGVEGSLIYIASKEESFTASSGPGGPIIASSPFVNPQNGLAQRVLISYPGVTSGSTSVDYKGNQLIGFDLYGRFQLCGTESCRVDGLVGYRHLNYDETLRIGKTLIPDPNGPIPAVPGTKITCDDDIRTESQFHGIALGFDLEKCCGPWSFNARPRVTIGEATTTVIRGGQTIIEVPGQQTQTLAGGTYNVVSNLGEMTTKGWTFVPELDLTVSRRLGDNWRIFAGYSLLYMPLVARAGNQLDTFVNPDLIPPAIAGATPNLPSAFVSRSSILFHGATVGVEFRY